MRGTPILAAAVAALSFAATGAAVAQAGPGPAGTASYAHEQLSSLDAQLHADAAAIQADKAQIDRDQQAGNQVALAQDKHRLFEATEQQEYDRGTSENDGMNDAKRGW